MAFLTQAMNQFAQAPILGAVDMIPSPNVVSAQITSSSSATAIQVGSPVKLVAGTSGSILVDVCSGPTDGPVFGVLLYNARKNLYVANDIVEVGCSDTFVYLRASAAVARGAKVTTTAATTTTDPLVTTVSVPSTQYVTGVAIDAAAAANDLIRVKIAPSFNLGV
jgi:hypothetical protein